MTTLFQDPPEVAQFAKRGDPPMSQWPGTIVTRQNIMEACGDPRDWFRYHHRYEAYQKLWAEWRDARQRRRNLMAGFEWNQILIIGEYGADKTTLGIKTANHFARRGHAVFSNASYLWGWRIRGEELYTAILFAPAASVFIFDEASASHDSRVAHGVALTTAMQQNLNTRKKNIMAIYISAHDYLISPGIRQEIKEVWMPVEVEQQARDQRGKRRDPANNPDTFRMAYHVWDNYPYKKRNLIEGKDGAREGFGPPDRTVYDEGENVRTAFLLNDTFELASVGAAMLADRNVVKHQLEGFHKGTGPVNMDGPMPDSPDAVFQDRAGKLLTFFAEQQDKNGGPPEFFKAAQLARAIGVASSQAGVIVQDVIEGVQPVRNKGYPSAYIYEYLSQWEGQ